MSFTREEKIAATRKARPCDGCRQKVEAGSPAVVWTGTQEGELVSATYHVECRAAEIALNEIHGNYWVDWMGLDEAEDDDWAALAEDHPIAAARFRKAPQ